MKDESKSLKRKLASRAGPNPRPLPETGRGAIPRALALLAIGSVSISLAGAAPTTAPITTIHLPALSAAQQALANTSHSPAVRAAYPFDYARGHRLFVPCPIRGSMVEINTRKNKIVAVVSGLPQIHGIALARGLGWASCGAADGIGEIDLIHPHLIRMIPAGSGPSTALWDEAARLVYVGDHAGKMARLLNPETRKVVATIPLGGEAAQAQVDTRSGLVYQNLEDTSEVVVVDPKKRRVVKRFSTGPGQHPTGLALDAYGRSLFCACANQKLVAIDRRSGHVIATLPIGTGAHSVAYDPGNRRVYAASSGSNEIVVIRQQRGERFTVVGNIPVHQPVYAIGVDPNTDSIYAIGSGEIDVLNPR
ncbi:MAG TPA: hypothetical protein VFJ58_04690 [Armatimonadota bacterium]|nr:hypothetical protein [Armatimonadota bacterium]